MDFGQLDPLRAVKRFLKDRRGNVAVIGVPIDGGLAMMYRAKAQSLADAGSLAGAAILAKSGSQTQAASVANQFATQRSFSII